MKKARRKSVQRKWWLRYLAAFIGLCGALGMQSSLSLAKTQIPTGFAKAKRVAVLVGAEHGKKGEPFLPSPVKRDLPKLQCALQKLGFAVALVKNPDKHEISRTLKLLGYSKKQAVFFYYSGHSGARGLHLGRASGKTHHAEVLGYGVLFKSLLENEKGKAKQYKQVMMVFDSCHSAKSFSLLAPRVLAKGASRPEGALRGALLAFVNQRIASSAQKLHSIEELRRAKFRVEAGKHGQAALLPKGLKPSPVEMTIPGFRPGEGIQIVGASTSAYDIGARRVPSRRPGDIDGSVFTHFFSEAISHEDLADQDQNGMISFREVYAHARARTLQHTTAGHAGGSIPQEMRRLSFQAGAMVMALSRKAKLRLGRKIAGQVQIISGKGFVYNQQKRAGKVVELRLPVGRHRLRIVTPGSCHEQGLALKKGKLVHLRTMPSAPCPKTKGMRSKGAPAIEITLRGRERAFLSLPSSGLDATKPRTKLRVKASQVLADLVRSWLSQAQFSTAQEKALARILAPLAAATASWSQSKTEIFGALSKKEKGAQTSVLLKRWARTLQQLASMKARVQACRANRCKSVDLRPPQTKQADAVASKRAMLRRWMLRVALVFAVTVALDRDSDSLSFQTLLRRREQAFHAMLRRLPWTPEGWGWLVDIEKQLRDGFPADLKQRFRQAVIPVMLQRGWTHPGLIGAAPFEAGGLNVALPQGWQAVESWLYPFFVDAGDHKKPFRFSLLPRPERNASDCFFRTERTHPIYGRCPLRRGIATHPLVLRILQPLLMQRRKQQDVKSFFRFLAIQAKTSPEMALSAGALVLQAASLEGVQRQDIHRVLDARSVGPASVKRPTKGSTKRPKPVDGRAWWTELAAEVVNTIVVGNDALLDERASYRAKRARKRWWSRAGFAKRASTMRKLSPFLIAWREPLLGNDTGFDLLREVARRRFVRTWKSSNQRSVKRIQELRRLTKKHHYVLERYHWNLRRFGRLPIGQGSDMSTMINLSQRKFRAVLAQAKRDHEALLAMVQNPLCADWLGEALLASPPRSLESQLFAMWLAERLYRHPQYFARAMVRSWPRLSRAALQGQAKMDAFTPWLRLRGRWNGLDSEGEATLSFANSPWSTPWRQEDAMNTVWAKLRSAQTKLMAAWPGRRGQSAAPRSHAKIALRHFRAWSSLLAWLGVPSLKRDAFQALHQMQALHLASKALVKKSNIAKDGKAGTASAGMGAAFEAVQRLATHLLLLSDMENKPRAGLALKHPFLMGADPWPPLFRSIRRLAKGCAKDSLCQRVALEQTALVAKRQLAVGHLNKAHRVRVEKLVDALRKLMSTWRAAGQPHGLSLQLDGLAGMLRAENRGNERRLLSLARAKAKDLWGLEYRLTLWSYLLTQARKGRCLDIRPLLRKRKGKLSKRGKALLDLQKRSRIALGLLSALLSHDDLQGKAPPLETMPTVRWATPVRWLSRYSLLSGQEHIVLAGLPWEKRRGLRHPLQQIGPLLQQAAQLDQHTHRSTRPVDIDGIGRDYSSPYSWAHIMYQLKNAKQRVTIWERRYVKEQRHSELKQGIKALKPLLAAPLVVSLSDYTQRVEASIAAVEQAESEHRSVTQKLLSFQLYRQARAIVREVARLELKRNRALKDVTKLDGERLALEREKLMVLKKIETLRKKSEKSSVEIQSLSKKQAKLEVQIRDKEVEITARGFVSIRQQVELLCHLLVNKMTVPGTNKKVYGQIGVLTYQLRKRVQKRLESIKEQLSKARKQLDELRERSWFKAIGSFLGAVVGFAIGGPFGLSVGAMIGGGIGHMVAQIKQGKKFSKIAADLGQTAISVGKAFGANYAADAKESYGVDVERLVTNLQNGQSLRSALFAQAPGILNKAYVSSGLQRAIEKRKGRILDQLEKGLAKAQKRSAPSSLSSGKTRLSKYSWKEFQREIKPHFKNLLSSSLKQKSFCDKFNKVREKIVERFRDLKVRSLNAADVLGIPKHVGALQGADTCLGREQDRHDIDDTQGGDLQALADAKLATKRLNKLAMESLLRAASQASRERTRLLPYLAIFLAKVQRKKKVVDDKMIRTALESLSSAEGDTFKRWLLRFRGRSLRTWAGFLSNEIERLLRGLYPKDSEQRILALSQIQALLDQQSLNAQLQSLLLPWQSVVKKRMNEIHLFQSRVIPGGLDEEEALQWQIGHLEQVAERYNQFLRWISDPKVNVGYNQMMLNLKRSQKKLKVANARLRQASAAKQKAQLETQKLELFFEQAGFKVKIATLAQDLTSIALQEVDLRRKQHKERTKRLALLIKQNILVLQQRRLEQRALEKKIKAAEALVRSAAAKVRLKRAEWRAQQRRAVVFAKLEDWYRYRDAGMNGLGRVVKFRRAYERAVQHSCYWGREALRFMRDVGSRHSNQEVKGIAVRGMLWSERFHGLEQKLRNRYSRLQPKVDHLEMVLTNAQVQAMYKKGGLCVSVRMRARADQIDDTNKGSARHCVYETRHQLHARLFGLGFAAWNGVGGNMRGIDPRFLKKPAFLRYEPFVQRTGASRGPQAPIRRRRMLLAESKSAGFEIPWKHLQKSFPHRAGDHILSEDSRNWNIFLTNQVGQIEGIKTKHPKQLRGVPLETTICFGLRAPSSHRATHARLILYYTHY